MLRNSLHAILALLLIILNARCTISPDHHEELIRPAPQNGDLLQYMKETSRGIGEITLNARIKLTGVTRRIPAIKASIKWKRMADRPTGTARITGTMMFGITLFDAIIFPDDLFLYIPSADTVYCAHKETRWCGMNTEETARMISLAINPWLSAVTGTITPCDEESAPLPEDALHVPSQTVCVSFDMDGKTGRAYFHKKRLVPLAIAFPGTIISYDASMEDHSTILPEVITIKSTRYDIKAEIDIISARNGTTSNAFDTSPFTSYPCAILSGCITE